MAGAALCPGLQLPCCVLTHCELRARIRARLLHSWRHQIGGGITLQSYGGTVVAFDPLYSRHKREAELAAEAAGWFPEFVAPALAAGTLSTQDRDAVGLWLKARSGMTEENLRTILTERARASEKSDAAYKRTFWRRVHRVVRVIKLGLVLAGRYVHPVPEAPGRKQRRS